MRSIWSHRQGALPDDRIERQVRIEMGKEITAARRFILQLLPQTIGINGDQQQTCPLKWRAAVSRTWLAVEK